jgi:tetratricopeptide (TPR) repeat protein
VFYYLIYYLILLEFTIVPPDVREETMRIQTALEENFAEEEYGKVMVLYDALQQKTPLVPPAISLTAAQSAQQLRDTTFAKPIYRQLAALNLPRVSTIAFNQLGVLAYQNKDFREALTFFRKALDNNPDYTISRYNYELVYKKYPPQNRNNTPRDKINEEQFEQQAKVTEQDAEKKDLLSQAVPPRMERERALQLLDAMRANELQGMSLRLMGGSTKKSKRNW